MSGRKLYSINALSEEIGIDRRTMASRLRDFSPDGQINGHAAYHLGTALSAVFEGGPASVPDQLATALRHVERIAADLQRGLDSIELEPSVDRRREMVQQFGHLVGDLGRALEATTNSDLERTVMGPFFERAVGGSIGTILHLCEWNLEAANGN
jgi:hypothetical protein